MSRITKALSVGIAAIAFATPAVANAADNPYARGGNPSLATLTATSGFYSVKKTAVADSATPGFGSATIWSPDNAPAGQTFGGVAVVPGFTGSEMTHLGPRLASQGFVVITINVGWFDLPDARATSLQASLDYLTSKSALKDRVDSSRLAVLGHSFGGGGALIAAKRKPSIKAVVAEAAFEFNKSFPLTTPTLLIAGKDDFVASAGSHSQPFYTSIPATTPKALLVLNGVNHYTFLAANTAIETASIAWLKRYVDNDTRYTPLLTPAPVGPPAGSVASYQTSSVS